VEVDHEIEPGRPKLSRERQIAVQAAPPARTRHDEDLIEMWIVSDNRRGFGLDEIADPGIGKTSPQRSDGWGCEDDIANQPRPDQQDFHK
jgi:hypothetical protein